jgi:hypothetical protein
VDGLGAGTNDADYDIWGPKFEGQLIPQYDSPVDPITGKRSGTPWVARGKDNLKRFIESGVLNTTNVSIASSTEKADLRFSLGNTYNKGIMPNTSLNISNLNLASTLRFNSKLTLDANINYSRQYSDNFPDVNYGPNSVIYTMTIWGGADWDVADMRNYWQPGKEGVQSLYAEYQREKVKPGFQKNLFAQQKGLVRHIAPNTQLTNQYTKELNDSLDYLIEQTLSLMANATEGRFPETYTHRWVKELKSAS